MSLPSLAEPQRMGPYLADPANVQPNGNGQSD